MSESSDESRMRDQQLLFARHDFDNLQALIRASDAKAAVFLTIMVFLVASFLQVAKDGVTKLHLHPYWLALCAVIFFCASSTLLITVLCTFLAIHRVLKPRGAQHYDATAQSPNLMWQDHVLQYPSNAKYYEALQSSSHAELLKNVTDQVYELAHISKQKMDALKTVRITILIAAWSWAAAIASCLILLTQK